MSYILANISVYSYNFTVIPSIVTHPSSIAVLIGQPVSLTCSATGPSIVYQWRKNGVTLSGGNLNMLTIYKTKESDEGTYQCIAINKAGNVTSHQAVIIIYGKPGCQYKVLFLPLMQTNPKLFN